MVQELASLEDHPSFPLRCIQQQKHSGTRPERRIYCIQELDHCSGRSTDSDTHQLTLHSPKLSCHMQGKHGKVLKNCTLIQILEEK